MSVTVPDSGDLNPAAAFTDPITAASSSLFRLRPISGKATNTISPSCFSAKVVMPTIPSWALSMRTHLWSSEKRSGIQGL